MWRPLSAAEAPLPELQPLAAQIRRVVEALDAIGSPLTPEQRAGVDSALAETVPALAVAKLDAVLSARTLFRVSINPEMRVKVAVGDAPPDLVEAGWTTFLVRVANEAGTTSPLKVESPQAKRVANAPAAQGRDLWLELSLPDAPPLRKELSGLSLEYRLIQLYSRDAGQREAKLSFNVGQGTQDLGFRSEADVLFRCAPAYEVSLKILDEHGQPTTASLLVTDSQGHVFPAQSKRLAPDFFFHPQVYRADGESLRLRAGNYTVQFARGPESLIETRQVEVKPGANAWRFQVQRWIDLAQRGWISGDHHIHAAGCAHYSKPTEGVHAPDMMRHVLGEDLKVGANLTWGPCFDYQKQFFRGTDDPVSRWPWILRYDVEVSGFGSHESGHLCLLRLREQMYPGGDSKDHWPKLGLNTLKWAKRQGGLVGPAHSGWGLDMDSTELPNFTVPPFSGIGANEYIVDVTHEVPGPDGTLVPAVDFLSTVDTPYPWELNIWYHTLNAGFRTRISGETDFPCIYSERVGLGRSYVKLPEKWTYEDWCEGIRVGRNYVSDGFSHLPEFQARANQGSVRMGEAGSELRLTAATDVTFSVEVAARLDETPQSNIQERKFTEHPYWHLERARLKGSRTVPVELIANGFPVARTNLVADGSVQSVSFTVPVKHSGWYAVRILPSSHTNPIFVVVDGKPIRSSRRSLEWCLKSVDQCWKQKEQFMKGEEHTQAVAAYEHARQVYRERLAEAVAE
ncbi:MAG: CehA/McbA family metallohydrolase [Verrucomicrobia bacterium]|nr:CehA/McbA family metallohydrolase [Verrucomicrobiota bacterium]